MAVYCRGCGTQRGLPIAAVRVADEACQFCGGFEMHEVRRAVGRPPDRRTLVTHEKLRNFDYPDRLIDSMPGSFHKQAEREYADVEITPKDN
jgi:hypothetical protein